MPEIKIKVCGRQCVNKLQEIVCQNSDYYCIQFEFSEEWEQFPIKTLRVQHGGEHSDVVFEGNSVLLPQITSPGLVKLGVFAGNLCTTTPALLNAVESILSESGSPAAPEEDVYAQIMELLNQLSGLPHANGLLYDDGRLYLVQDGEAVGEGIAISGGTGDHTQLTNRDAADQHPISSITGLSSALDGKQPAGNYLTEATLTTVIDAALAQAKESGEFDGAPGQDGVPGEKGDKGDKGDQGDTGPQGETGAPGATGSAGQNGADGKSAYELAVEQGYSGTLTEWLASLHGADGQDGEKGDKGDTGETGPQGPAGTPGQNGANGQDGAPGQDGYTPVKGTDYFTAEDKAELVNDVLAALPSAEGVCF